MTILSFNWSLCFWLFWNDESLDQLNKVNFEWNSQVAEFSEDDWLYFNFWSTPNLFWAGEMQKKSLSCQYPEIVTISAIFYFKNIPNFEHDVFTIISTSIDKH